MCKNCGEVIRKGRERKHYDMKERNAICTKCDRLCLDPKTVTSTKMLPDGTVKQVTINDAKCKISWYNRKKISEVNKASECKYFACRKSGTMELKNDFFSLYKDPFDVLVTESAAIAAGWTTKNGICRGAMGRRYMTCNDRVEAIFDKNGIIMYFVIHFRNNDYEVAYSKKYDKFMNSYGNEFRWPDMSERTATTYKRAIRQLYNVTE